LRDKNKKITMSFSDLFDSEFKQRNKGHFASIVRLALADGVFAPEEKEFLDKLAIRLEISAAEYEEILENPTKYPINPPYLNTQRIERLYDLARIVNIDHHLGDNQEVMLQKLSLGIGFTPENVNAVVTKALELADEKADLDTFIEEIEKVEKLHS
tara:strand:- start:542 stop:1009 length:468 start_codon:yes stop_codon:yes gene_type:complete